MSAIAATQIISSLPLSSDGPPVSTDRRHDIDAKQALVAGLLERAQCDGLLVLEPENFAWLTSGGAARGVVNPAELPGLYFSAESRWVLSSNVDSQRLFDEELDGLGFQLKEWPWHWGREQLLTELSQGRALACDRPLEGGKLIADDLRSLRRPLTTYEQACYRALGQLVGHALEATCRTMNPGDTEREVAGHLSHRLLHRGAYPIGINVAADGRFRLYRRSGFTSAPVRNSCVVQVLARKYGLCVCASRAVCFGTPDPALQREHDTVCKVTATYIAGSWPDSLPKQILAAGKRVYQLNETEHEWLLSCQGEVTGHSPVELLLTPRTEDLFHAGWAVSWRGSAGAALSCDTILVADQGPVLITPTENWPLKRIRVQGADFVRPDLLVR